MFDVYYLMMIALSHLLPQISVGFVEALVGNIVTFLKFDIPLMSHILYSYIYTPFEKCIIPSQTKQL